jgi:hypothetical protein
MVVWLPAATDCRQQLFPQKTCTLRLEFIPAKPISYSSTLTIYDNAANAYQMIRLSASNKK